MFKDYFKKRKIKKMNKKAMEVLNVKRFNYEESDEVNKIFDKLFEIPWSKVEFDSHYTIVTTVTDLRVSIWSANAYSAWASQGFIRRRDQDNRYASRSSADNIFSWDDAMPSPWRMLEMDKRFKDYKKQIAYDTIDSIFDENAVTNKADSFIENFSVNL